MPVRAISPSALPLVHPFAPEEIAEKLIAALEAPQDFAALRKNARQSVIETYDLKRICLPGQKRLIEEARALQS